VATTQANPTWHPGFPDELKRVYLARYHAQRCVVNEQRIFRFRETQLERTKRGRGDPKPVLHVETGVVYPSQVAVCQKFNFHPATFSQRLSKGVRTVYGHFKAVPA